MKHALFDTTRRRKCKVGSFSVTGSGLKLAYEKICGHYSALFRQKDRFCHSQVRS